MASRHVLYLSHAESDGDALGSKTITVTKPDGSALGVSLYEQVSGGSPSLSPETNSAGLKLLYANAADLDAEAVGRVKVSYSDAPATTFDDAFFPDPLDLFIDGMTRSRELAGGLELSGTVGLTSAISHATNYAGSFQNAVGGVSQVHMGAGGSGYSNSFAVAFTGGGGSGAAGTATASGGIVIAVTVTNAGSGYTSAPTVDFSAGGGTSATATALLSSPVLEVKDVSGAQAFWVDGNHVRIGAGKRLSVGTTATPVDNLVLFFESVVKNPPYGQTVAIETNVTAGTSGDYSALRSVIRDYANNQIHAAEFHLLSNTVVANSGGGQSRSALTLSAQVETAGATGIENSALRIISGIFPEITTPAATDNAILINYGGGSEFTNFIKAYAVDGTVRFQVETSGRVTAGTMLPRANDTYEIGAAATRWLRMFSNVYIAENASAAGPAHTYRTDGTSGQYLVGTGILGMSAGGAEKARFDSSGFAYAAGCRVQENTVATITPTTLSANADNYNPTGLATASRLRLSSDASRNITGIVAQTAGTVLHLQNVGAQNIVLKEQTTSTATNQIALPSAGDVTIPPKGAYTLIYDGTLTRWIQYAG